MEARCLHLSPAEHLCGDAQKEKALPEGGARCVLSLGSVAFLRNPKSILHVKAAIQDPN
jgi:hypothetical protein